MPPAITVSGTPISLATSLATIVIGTSAIPINVPVTTVPVITVNGSTITENTAGDFVIGTQTLMPGGPPITTAGTSIFFGPAGTNVVVGTSTLGIEDIISELDGGQTPTTTGLVGTPFTGGARSGMHWNFGFGWKRDLLGNYMTMFWL